MNLYLGYFLVRVPILLQLGVDFGCFCYESYPKTRILMASVNPWTWFDLKQLEFVRFLNWLCRLFVDHNDSSLSSSWSLLFQHIFTIFLPNSKLDVWNGVKCFLCISYRVGVTKINHKGSSRFPVVLFPKCGSSWGYGSMQREASLVERKESAYPCRN